MIDSIEKDVCTGCKMCGDICPTAAIKFKEDYDGCWYPSVDDQKCIKCGLCEKRCPAIHPIPSHNSENPSVYAAWTKDDKVRFDSTSGGIYYELAHFFIESGGYIAGCAFSDDFKSAKHVIGNTSEDLHKIMGSKYFQSDTQGIYKGVSDLLKRNEKVLFCGTPCQVAALRAYLGKEYDNLFLLDFICKGINSPKAYTAYINEIEHEYKSSIKCVRQKSKKTGWQSLATNIVFENGKEYHKDRYTDWWIQGYTCGNLFMRQNCQKCLYKTMPRQADLSFGDFWGIKSCSETDYEKGISVVFINSQKGMQLLENANDKIHLENRSLEEVLAGNPYLFGQAVQKGNRKKFFELLNTEPFSKAVKSTYTENPEQKLKRYTKLFLKRVLKRKKW